MFFEDENIEKLRNGEYEALLKIALYARYDTEDDILNRILGDARFELPADFDIYYSDESEMDEKLKFIRNKSIIEDFLLITGEDYSVFSQGKMSIVRRLFLYLAR